MKTQNQPLAAFLVAAVMAAALPAAAAAEMSSSDRFVTRALDNNGPTVPHRPETDIHFPRR